MKNIDILYQELNNSKIKQTLSQLKGEIPEENHKDIIKAYFNLMKKIKFSNNS